VHFQTLLCISSEFNFLVYSKIGKGRYANAILSGDRFYSDQLGVTLIRSDLPSVREKKANKWS